MNNTLQHIITSAAIINLSYQHAVTATLDSGETTELFRYYPDELGFTPDEFVGLTVEDGIELFTIKDMAYLGAPYTSRRERKLEAERQERADKARSDWWKAWEHKVLAKRSGLNCILRAPKFAGYCDWDDIEF
jgi:hypothetical protein